MFHDLKAMYSILIYCKYISLFFIIIFLDFEFLSVFTEESVEPVEASIFIVPPSALTELLSKVQVKVIVSVFSEDFVVSTEEVFVFV